MLAERARDTREAARLYAEAARDGVAQAARNAARLAQAQRERVTRDAFVRLRERARAGDTSAMIALARAFHRGEGVAADYTEALRWYRLAALRGDAEAKRMLTLITARPRDEASIDPPWMSALARQEVASRGRLVPIASAQPPLGERDPLAGLDTLHLHAFHPTHCEVSP